MSLLKGRKRLPPSSTMYLPEKYLNGHPIKAKKLDDLENMVPFLPPKYRQFYLDLLAATPRDNSVDSSDDNDED